MPHTADLELSAPEIRVLGCLIEKERATPDQYPLTTNALRTACNQKTNREPVVDYDEATVDRTMLSLRDRGFARTVTGGGRTVKHKQVVDEALALTGPQVSVLGVLLLRGAQTVNELRTRTERLNRFDDNDGVEAVLAELERHDPPLVTCLGRAPGQREDRWTHLLAGPVDESQPEQPAPAPAPAPIPEATVTGPTVDELAAEVAALRAELAQLRDRFDDLAAELGF